MDTNLALALQTQRFEKKREAILDAAARVFNQKGVKGATLADVARNVALITNSLTYYYRRKEDLASAAFVRTIDVLNALAARARDADDPRERLALLFRTYAGLLADIARGNHPELMYFHDIRALRSPHVESVFEAYTDMFRRMRDLLPARGSTAVERAALNARAHLVVTAIHSMRSLISRYEVEDYGRVAERVADILIFGLGNCPARFAPHEITCLAGAQRSAIAADAFLRSATCLINEQGYRGASVEKISARLNVTKGSSYHHHDNKDDLVASCFQRSFEVIRDAQDGALALTADGWTKLSSIATELVRYQVSEQGPLLRHTALSALPEEMRRGLVATMDRLSLRYAHFLVDGCADGSLRPVDQTVAAHLISGVIDAASELRRWVSSAGPDNAAALFVRPLFLGLFAH
ncbi:MAG: TetR family transcriptional regulator [Alphaproteobacteria bacterium]|nr:TetR family transcriptional regulator [Alphaproteobacteria bacterium]